EIATTGSAALARVDTATRATAPTSNLMKSLLVLVVGVGAGTGPILSCHPHEQPMRRLSPIHYTGPFAAMPYHCFSRAATPARHFRRWTMNGVSKTLLGMTVLLVPAVSMAQQQQTQ